MVNLPAGRRLVKVNPGICPGFIYPLIEACYTRLNIALITKKVMW